MSHATLRRPRARRITAALTSLLLLTSTFAAAASASADTAPQPPETVTTVSADSLPTVQVNGVVWDQVIVGSTVYVTGKFTKARPAGAAAGTNESTRNNALAYNLNTGVMTSWAPSLNAQGMTIAASEDGSVIYIGGDFTTVNASTRNRIAAVNASTGAVIDGFSANANNRVASIAVSGNTLYLGGMFTTLGSQTRSRLAAVSATTGAVSATFKPTADQAILAVAVPRGKNKVVVAGRLELLNNVATRGMGAVDATNGANLPWQINQTVQNFGPNSAIWSLSTDGEKVYGTGYDYFGPSEFEGSFAASADDGSIEWISACKGDSYDTAPVGDVLYSVGHPHDCAMIGGHPQTEPWTFQRAMATTSTPDGVNAYGPFGGQPKPRLLAWEPTLAAGSFTGKSQAAWTATGNDQYVVLGGEFPRVNGVAQQGLARFAVRTIAPNKQGPQGATELKPSAISFASGSVRLGWTAAFDRDNRNLTYEVLRGSTTATSTVLASMELDSNWWNRPRMSFTDSAAPVGTSQTYRIRVKDALGNTVVSSPTAYNVPTDLPPLSSYGQGVLAKGASSFWRFGESSGTTAFDWVGSDDLKLAADVTRSSSGAIVGDANGSAQFPGSGGVPAVSGSLISGPQTFTIEAWVNTTSTTGGKIVGFGNSNTDSSGSYDRHIYMDDEGRITFGVYPGDVRRVTTAPGFNDGQWHHVVATLGSGGMSLYVDGTRLGRDASVTSAQEYEGYWRVGGDNYGGWPATGSSSTLTGRIDDVAIYPTALSAAQVTDQYTRSGRTAPADDRPSDAYGQAVYDDEPDSYWRLDETDGTRADDITMNSQDGLYSGGVQLGQAGKIGKAAALDGIDGLVSSQQQQSGPSVYSQELWFKTTSTSGGKLIGFGSDRTGSSSSYDRHVYMFNDGRLRFGVWTGDTNVIDSSDAYNDGKWHHMVATQGSDGMKLYVDSVLVGTNPQTAQQDYSGYWRVGGDNTWGGADSNHIEGLVDEVAVYSKVLSPTQIAAHFTAAGGEAPNQAPTAAFTATVTGLSVAFDASGSSDADGTVNSYTWEFGDGTSQTTTTPTASHSYGSAGTWTVKLTVTDDDAATGSTAKPVTTAAAPVNQAPTAAFTATVTGLSVAFDASGSSDADGTVNSYTWEFGDGTSQTTTTPTASHSYGSAGTWTVKLTVTDDDAATGSTTGSVTTVVAPVTFVAQDLFNRTVANGLGTADVGGAWTTVGTASRFSVSGGQAVFNHTAGAQKNEAWLTGGVVSGADVRVTVSADANASGGGTYINITGRRVDATNRYDGRVRWISGNRWGVSLTANKASSAETSLTGEVVLPGTFAPGDRLNVRVQATGTNPTTIRVKAWPEGQSEPTAWTVERTDTFAGLQTSGHPGLQTYLSKTATTLPVAVRFANYEVKPL